MLESRSKTQKTRTRA